VGANYLTHRAAWSSERQSFRQSLQSPCINVHAIKSACSKCLKHFERYRDFSPTSNEFYNLAAQFMEPENTCRQM
jgi:hypothetical protein